MTAPARTPGRPRSTEADAAIAHATLAVLREDGFQGLSVEAVRERAGVGKATIYRRFGDKTELVVAALRAFEAELRLPDTGTLRGDLEAAWRMAYASARGADAGTFIPRLLAESTRDLELHRAFRRALVEPRREAIATLLRRGVERGELRADVDVELIVDLLVGPVLYRMLIEAGRLEGAEDYAIRLFDTILPALAP